MLSDMVLVPLHSLPNFILNNWITVLPVHLYRQKNQDKNIANNNSQIIQSQSGRSEIIGWTGGD